MTLELIRFVVVVIGILICIGLTIYSNERYKSIHRQLTEISAVAHKDVPHMVESVAEIVPQMKSLETKIVGQVYEDSQRHVEFLAGLQTELIGKVEWLNQEVADRFDRVATAVEGLVALISSQFKNFDDAHAGALRDVNDNTKLMVDNLGRIHEDLKSISNYLHNAPPATMDVKTPLQDGIPDLPEHKPEPFESRGSQGGEFAHPVQHV